jgi:hypothetical protein
MLRGLIRRLLRRKPPYRRRVTQEGIDRLRARGASEEFLKRVGPRTTEREDTDA